VSSPGETIANDREKGQESEASSEEKQEDKSDHTTCPNEMESSANDVCMLRQIEWVKLFKRFIFHQNFSGNSIITLKSYLTTIKDH
jgi:hypothetical protein